MPSKSPKQQRFFQAVKKAKDNPNAPEHLRKVADSMTEKDINDFANSLAEFKVKKAMVAILKDVRESINDIHDPMYLDEEIDKPSVDPVADKKPIKKNWAEYITPFVGQPFSEKEIDALSNYEKKEPVTIKRTEIWYKGTDEFGTNRTTLIKKMKDSGQYSYTAFQKEELPEVEDDSESQSMNAGGPEGDMGEFPGEEIPDQSTETPVEEEQDNIIVTKSILFKDDVKGASILIDFLKKLNL